MPIDRRSQHDVLACPSGRRAEALPPPPGGLAQVRASPRQRVLEQLRGQIQRIERSAWGAGLLPGTGGTTPSAPRAAVPAWTLGDREIDARLGREGLEIGGVHEIKPALPAGSSSWAACAAAALAFALALAGRRAALPDQAACAPVLCCRRAAAARETGLFYAPGLRALGIDPARLLIAEPVTAAQVLWAMEEGLGSSSLALVLGLVEDVALTPARRLALAAAGHGTPCLLLTHPRAGPAAATATRWRIEPVPAAPHPFDGRAPGALALAVEIERCRARPASAGAAFIVGWCDETRCFRVVSRLADRAARPRRSARGAR